MIKKKRKRKQIKQKQCFKPILRLKTNEKNTPKSWGHNSLTPKANPQIHDYF